MRGWNGKIGFRLCLYARVQHECTWDRTLTTREMLKAGTMKLYEKKHSYDNDGGGGEAKANHTHAQRQRLRRWLKAEDTFATE